MVEIHARLNLDYEKKKENGKNGNKPKTKKID